MLSFDLKCAKAFIVPGNFCGWPNTKYSRNYRSPQHYLYSLSRSLHLTSCGLTAWLRLSRNTGQAKASHHFGLAQKKKKKRGHRSLSFHHRFQDCLPGLNGVTRFVRTRCASCSTARACLVMEAHHDRTRAVAAQALTCSRAHGQYPSNTVPVCPSTALDGFGRDSLNLRTNTKEHRLCTLHDCECHECTSQLPITHPLVFPLYTLIPSFRSQFLPV
jgi:hypothetical protein